MYLNAPSHAAQMRGVVVVRHPRSGEREFASHALGVSLDTLSEFVRGIRQTLGPPWQKDHHAATAAALGGLAGVQQLSLPYS